MNEMQVAHALIPQNHIMTGNKSHRHYNNFINLSRAQKMALLRNNNNNKSNNEFCNRRQHFQKYNMIYNNVAVT